MTVGELKAILAGYPDDLKVVGNNFGDLSEMRWEVREWQTRYGGAYDETLLQIRHWNYCHPIGRVKKVKSA